MAVGYVWNVAYEMGSSTGNDFICSAAGGKASIVCIESIMGNSFFRGA